MENNLKNGPHLSDEEYDRLIVELHSNVPAMPDKQEYRQVRLKELNLAIDHRLGVDFPQEKRDKLWDAAERVEAKRIKLAAKYFFSGLFSRSRIGPGLINKSDWLTRFMVDAYSEVLDERELRCFFGLDEGERPSLPIDRE